MKKEKVPAPRRDFFLANHQVFLKHTTAGSHEVKRHTAKQPRIEKDTE